MKNTTTFVTAFFNLNEDRSANRPIIEYLNRFRELASTGICLKVITCNKYYKDVSNICLAYSNVEIVKVMELSEFGIYNLAKDMLLPEQRTIHHDTRNFMVMMLAKTECVDYVLKRDKTINYVGWIDFGVYHVVKKSKTNGYLQMIGRTNLRGSFLAMPGCWEKTNSFKKCINWRFCGGYFVGDRHSVLDFCEKVKNNFEIYTKDNILTWEVNYWAWLEYENIIKPDWYKADHSDEMLYLPSKYISVMASLTSIPTREESCRASLDSLINQVDKIYLTLSKYYKRFPSAMEYKKPDYLDEEPYKSKIVVNFKEDEGPGLKYLGAIVEETCNNWIFFGDDDQEYHPDLISKIKDSLQNLSFYQNRYHIVRYGSGGIIHGFVGNMAHRSLLDNLESFDKPMAMRYVDDQWMSIYCFKNNIQICATGIEDYGEIFGKLYNKHEKHGKDALSALDNRVEKINQLCVYFDITFNSDGTIVSNRDRLLEKVINHRYAGQNREALDIIELLLEKKEILSVKEYASLLYEAQIVSFYVDKRISCRFGVVIIMMYNRYKSIKDLLNVTNVKDNLGFNNLSLECCPMEWDDFCENKKYKKYIKIINEQD